ncbi:diphthine synthase [Candidatus Woesearchaeota archaeon]|nr:diphthine synthase [Candidatus Woesearchaeota archaeon]
MLYLIGLGLSDAKDISVKGLEAVKKCNEVFLESYTCKLNCEISDLENMYGKKVKAVNRDFVENAAELLKKAKNADVALLIIGDPLSATTHWDIMQRAKEQNIAVEVIHNASIFSGIAAAGLQLYKFGKTASIPHTKDGYKPETAYDLIKENQSIGAHTLCLLDTQPEFMTVNEAIQILLDIESRRKEKIFTEDTLCVGCARIGAQDQLIKAGKAKDLLNYDFGAPVHCLVIPGKLHFVEEEAIQRLSL